MSLAEPFAILLVTIALCSCPTQASPNGARPKFVKDVIPDEARNVREEGKYRYMLANEYEDAMNEAQDNDDVEDFERNLEKMRKESRKFNELEQEYNEMRQNLEMRVRNGEIIIEGFPIVSTKGRFASFMDHVTGRVQN